MIIQSSKAGYEVGKKVAETAEYTLYLCKQIESNQQYLLQIAKDLSKSGKLSYTAHILSKLHNTAEELEVKYKKVKPDRFLNYQLSFPNLIESFVPENQGKRRINILEFLEIPDIGQLVPLSRLVQLDHLQVDVRTSIWIMGKLLKILVLAHSAGIAVTDLGFGNILIYPNQHFVIIFNWAEAQIIDGGLDSQMVRNEIKSAAQSVIKVLGGSLEKGISNDGSNEEVTYCEHLMQLARLGASRAMHAHEEFYSLVDSLWSRGFHEFTTIPIITD